MKTLIIRINGDVEESIIGILEASYEPVCVSTISFLLGIPTYKVCQCLIRLEKYKKARQVTVSKVGYWK